MHKHEKRLLTVGNIYIDHNIFGVDSSKPFLLEGGNDYFGTGGERVLGGSAINAAMQARRLDIDVAFIGKTGQDEGAKEVRVLLENEGIRAELIKQDSSRTTSMAVNVVDNHGDFIGIHYGDASRQLTAEDIDLNHPLVATTDGIYLGGTIKQPILFKDLSNLFARVSCKGIKIFYDPNRFPAVETPVDRTLLMKQLAYVEGYFPNEEELLQATNSPSIDDALEMALKTGVKFVALKLGARGCHIKTANQDIAVAGVSVDPKTTVGAGDCFNATFIAYYLNGYDLKECALNATKAASIKVGQNIWPTKNQIEQVVDPRVSAIRIP